MTWRLKFVLWFVGMRKPVDVAHPDIPAMRRDSTKASKLGSKLFDKKMPVEKVTDTATGGIPLRIYQSGTGQRVIIYYHGGGFVLYGLDSHDYVCRRLSAMNQCIVVSVDYRLAPEHTFPAAHEDAYTALLWVRKNISTYGGDPDDIVVAGDSAGGNLSACMAHRCRKEHIKLSAQVLIYPWIDGKLNNPSITRNGEGYMLTKEITHWFQAQYTPRVEDRCVPVVSPCYESEFTGLAPAFILTAEYDPLLDDGFNYYTQLKAAGNKAKYTEYKALVHGFINIPGVDPNGMKAFADIRKFLSGV